MLPSAAYRATDLSEHRVQTRGHRLGGSQTSDARFIRAAGRLVAMWVVLGVAFGACAPRSGGPAVATVMELERAWTEGDAARAHALVDFAYRIEEGLGDVWRSGTEGARDEAVGQATAMFDETMERYWKSQFEGRPRTTRTLRTEGPHVWVESRASGDGRSEFAWIYRLTSLNGRLRVTAREVVLGSTKSNTSAFYRLALKRIGGEYGRTPTLSELNANLPSLAGRLKQRTFKVPGAEGRAP